MTLFSKVAAPSIAKNARTGAGAEYARWVKSRWYPAVILSPVSSHMKTQATISTQVTPWVRTYQGTTIAAASGVRVRNATLPQTIGR